MLLHWKRMPKAAKYSPSMTGLSRARNASWLASIRYKTPSKPVKLSLCPFSFPVDIHWIIYTREQRLNWCHFWAFSPSFFFCIKSFFPTYPIWDPSSEAFYPLDKLYLSNSYITLCFGSTNSAAVLWFNYRLLNIETSLTIWGFKIGNLQRI